MKLKTVSIPDDLHLKLKLAATSAGQPIGEFTTELLKAGLKKGAK